MEAMQGCGAPEHEGCYRSKRRRGRQTKHELLGKQLAMDDVQAGPQSCDDSLLRLSGSPGEKPVAALGLQLAWQFCQYVESQALLLSRPSSC